MEREEISPSNPKERRLQSGKWLPKMTYSFPHPNILSDTSSSSGYEVKDDGSILLYDVPYAVLRQEPTGFPIATDANGVRVPVSITRKKNAILLTLDAIDPLLPATINFFAAPLGFLPYLS
jgi:hypothetical protein